MTFYDLSLNFLDFSANFFSLQVFMDFLTILGAKDKVKHARRRAAN